MALAPCNECGHDISSEARKCPNCGAKNRAYRSKTLKYWLFAIVLGAVGFITYVYHWYEYESINCDTSEKRKQFASVINNSSYFQLNKLRVIDITNIKTVKSGDTLTDLVCEANINFNSREKMKYRFAWRSSESGALLIHAKEIR